MSGVGLRHLGQEFFVPVDRRKCDDFIADQKASERSMSKKFVLDIPIKKVGLPILDAFELLKVVLALESDGPRAGLSIGSTVNV